jgi:AraC-like DNA-binding protein
MSLRWRAGDSIEFATCRAVLLEILLRLLVPAGLSSVQRHSPSAQLAKEYLDAARSGDSIRHVLESTGYSYAHLCRAFKVAFGLSPLAYLRAGKIERAKQYLTDPHITITAVARLSGFDDLGYFIRIFKHTVGVSPRTFQKRRLSTQATCTIPARVPL